MGEQPKMKRAAEVPNNSMQNDMETVPNDLSILRKPIKTSVNGFNEARKAYEDGTHEVSCFHLTYTHSFTCN